MCSEQRHRIRPINWAFPLKDPFCGPNSRWAHSRMKAEFQILKAKPKIPVVLTHDSVCAGDDCDAPHEKTVEVYSFVDPEAFAREISSGYLPSVAGVGHSWTCVLNGVRTAEVTTSSIRALVRESPFSEENRAHFVYHSSTF